MRRVWLFGLYLALIGGCVAMGREWSDDTPHPLLAGPYVMVTGPNSAIVAFRNIRGGDAKVIWNAEGEGDHGGTLPVHKNGDLYWVQVEGLPRGPTIRYGVSIAGKAIANGSFRVGPAADEKRVRFAVFGDTRTNHMVHRSVIEAVAKEQIDFFLHTGDMVERGGREDLWITFFEIERPLLEKAAIFPSIGNHDLGNRGYYNKYFFLDRWAHGKSWYIADWGPVRVVSLDDTIICGRRCAQYEFVRKGLEEGAAKDQLMVLFLHYPPYSSGAHGSDLQLRTVLGELAKRYGVELVITGHDHNYERTVSIDGTTYMVSGSAGAPVRPIQPQAFTAAARTEPHYVIVDVADDRLTARAINLRGEVFDNVTIEDNPPGGRPPEAKPGAASVSTPSGAITAP